MNDMSNRRAYYAIIPASVRYDTALRPNAKLLYGELTALAGEEGFCWASNAYFANLYGLSKKTISELISLLAERGYITLDFVQSHETNDQQQRRIYINAALPPTPPEKSGGGTPKKPEKAQGGTPKNREGAPEKSGSYIRMNNTKNNTPIAPKEILDKFAAYSGTNSSLLAALLDFADNRKQLKAPLKTARAASLLLAKLDRLSNGSDTIKLRLLDEAIEKGWKSVYPLKADLMPAPEGVVETEDVSAW